MTSVVYEEVERIVDDAAKSAAIPPAIEDALGEAEALLAKVASGTGLNPVPRWAAKSASGESKDHLCSTRRKQDARFRPRTRDVNERHASATHVSPRAM